MLLDLFLIGLVITLEPIPLTAMILLLSAERGAMKGLGFIIGWFGSLVAIVAAVILIVDGKPPRPHTNPSTAALVVKLVIGLGLLLVAARRRRRRDRPRKPPTWMAKLNGISFAASAGLGVLLQPWPLVAAGVATVTEAKLTNAGEYVLIFAFCVLGSASLLAMELYAVFSPDAARARLDAIRNWIDTHRDQVIVVLSLLLGLYLMGKSIYGLVTG